MSNTRRHLYSGQKISCLTVLAEDGKLNDRPAYRLQCDCGNIVYKEVRYFSKERTLCSPQCGFRKPTVLKHGAAIVPQHRRSGSYRSWLAMRQRCLDPKSKSYANYGGRGIKICERWHDFALFLEDMGERPAGLTIDRKEVNGDYEPSNCRWATASDQNLNKRSK